MTVGFASSSETKAQYINNYMKQSNRLLSGFKSLEEAVEEYQKLWVKSSKLKDRDFTRDELLNPKLSELRIKRRSLNQPLTSSIGSKISLDGTLGLWRINITSQALRVNEFTIMVNCGGYYAFLPDTIQQVITTRFDSSTYMEWRKLIMDDIESLHSLVKAVRPVISEVVNSMTCGKRSARLCKRIGIPVHRNTAFLFPAKYN